MAKQTQLTLPNDRRGYYVPSDFTERMTMKQLKDEYTRIRDILRKRINRLEKAGIYTKSELERMRSMFPKIADLKETSDATVRDQLIQALSDSSRLANREATTIPEARAREKSYKEDLIDLLLRELPKLFTREELEHADIDWFAFGEFLNYTRQGVSFLYWNGNEIKMMFNTDELKDMLANYEKDLEGHPDFSNLVSTIRGYKEIQGKKERS